MDDDDRTLASQTNGREQSYDQPCTKTKREEETDEGKKKFRKASTNNQSFILLYKRTLSTYNHVRPRNKPRLHAAAN